VKSGKPGKDTFPRRIVELVPPNQNFSLNPTKKTTKWKDQSRKKWEGPRRGGTDFFLDLSWNVVTKFVVFKEIY
jgi:hypothetical protein